MRTLAKVGAIALVVFSVLVGCTYVADSLWGSDGLAVAPIWVASLLAGITLLVGGRRPELGAGLVGGAAAFAIVALKYLGDFGA